MKILRAIVEVSVEPNTYTEADLREALTEMFRVELEGIQWPHRTPRPNVRWPKARKYPPRPRRKDIR